MALISNEFGVHSQGFLYPHKYSIRISLGYLIHTTFSFFSYEFRVMSSEDAKLL